MGLTSLGLEIGSFCDFLYSVLLFNAILGLDFLGLALSRSQVRGRRQAVLRPGGACPTKFSTPLHCFVWHASNSANGDTCPRPTTYECHRIGPNSATRPNSLAANPCQIPEMIWANPVRFCVRQEVAVEAAGLLDTLLGSGRGC